MFYRLIYFSLSLLLSTVSFGQEYSLQKCVELALKNNISVRNTEVRTKQSAVNLIQSKNNRLPSVNGGLNYGYNQGRAVNPITNTYINQTLTSSDLSINAQATLYNGHKVQNQIRKATLDMEAAEMTTKQIEEQLTLDVITAFANIIGLEDVLAIAEAQLTVTEKTVADLAIRVKENASIAYSLAELEAQLTNEKIALLDNKMNLQKAKIRLCQLMNISMDGNIKIDRSNVNVQDEILATINDYKSSDVYQTALNHMSVFKVNDVLQKSGKMDEKIIKADLLPALFVNGSIGSNYSNLARKLTPTTIEEIETGDFIRSNNLSSPVLRKQQLFDESKVNYIRQLNNNLGTYLGLRINIPIFNKFVVRNQLELNKLKLEELNLTNETNKLQLYSTIENLHVDLQNSKSKIGLLNEQKTQLEEVFRAAKIRFDNGVITTPVFLISKNNLDDVLINLVIEKNRLYFNSRLLDFYTGNGVK
jgi:outer membrane protein